MIELNRLVSGWERSAAMADQESLIMLRIIDGPLLGKDFEVVGCQISKIEQGFYCLQLLAAVSGQDRMLYVPMDASNQLSRLSDNKFIAVCREGWRFGLVNKGAILYELGANPPEPGKPLR